MGITAALKFRIDCRKRKLCAICKLREFTSVANRTDQIGLKAILHFLTIRNENPASRISWIFAAALALTISIFRQRVL